MLVAVLAVFIFGDTGYTAYFSSFFGESLVMVTMILVFASWLLLYRKRYNDYAMLAILVISTVILTTSKQQNAPVGMVISLLAIPLIWIRRDKLFRWITIASAALMMFTGIATYLNISKEFVNINQYHAMTRGVLMESENPETALQSFGINEQYAILKGNTYYDQYGTVDVKSELLEKKISTAGMVSSLFSNTMLPIRISSARFLIRPPKAPIRSNRLPWGTMSYPQARNSGPRAISSQRIARLRRSWPPVPSPSFSSGWP
ncbi:hypothetical protein ACFTAO_45460 [Paenibacillus rhizoplanae]